MSVKPATDAWCECSHARFDHESGVGVCRPACTCTRFVEQKEAPLAKLLRDFELGEARIRALTTRAEEAEALLQRAIVELNATITLAEKLHLGREWKPESLQILDSATTLKHEMRAHLQENTDG